jgi:thioredoxin 1
MKEVSGDDCFRVLDDSKMVLFYFTASWCGPCQRISPKVEELSNKISERVNTYKISIDNDENSEICEKCQIKSVPTFILFKNRSSLGIINGGKLDELINLIKNNLQ